MYRAWSLLVLLQGFDDVFGILPLQAHSLKKNIGQFSGFVWVEDEVLLLLSLFYLVIESSFCFIYLHVKWT